MKCSNVDSLRSYDFPGVLKERVPGTPGHDEVHQVNASLVRHSIIVLLPMLLFLIKKIYSHALFSYTMGVTQATLAVSCFLRPIRDGIVTINFGYYM